MQNRKLVLADGTVTTINDAEWTGALVNVKKFDATKTEIVRVIQNPRRGLVRVHCSRSVGGAVAAERNEIVLEDSDLGAVIERGLAACAIGDETKAAALAALRGGR